MAPIAKLGLAVALGLATMVSGCATPLQHCLSVATRDVRDIERELDERNANVRRGYRIERIQVPELLPMACVGPRGRSIPCERWTTTTEEIHYPVNRDLERERIALLETQLARAQRSVPQAEAQCRATYPEG